jgi:beta-ribofuranosylaminobenzene 5'-phosphate synthase
MMLGVDLQPATGSPQPAVPVGGVVRVAAPARLHLGFLDPGASLGRRFGSLGLVIEGFDTVLSLQAASADRAQAAGPREQQALPRAQAALAALRQATGLQAPLQLRLEQVPPAHAGFGTGTQLALAVGRAFATLHGLVLDTPALARITGRGLRSGVGVAGFDAGGLLVDAGPGAAGGPAPLIARVDLPAAWRVLLVLDPRVQGLHGDAERAALATLAPLSQAHAAALCHDTLMRVLPGAIDADFAAFAAGLNHMQALLGEHFAPAQPGGAYTSPAVGRLLGALAQVLPAAVGQSSWGPTGFAVVPTADGLDAWLARARSEGLADPALELRLVQPRGRGAVVSRIP